mmetsp:Transcript_41331/g.109482  ORF Transcript_41331/g.109482 Transcript_41331/m.109482 type:complete len:225 (-) Transcript_41331:1011-1685(-)
MKQVMQRTSWHVLGDQNGMRHLQTRTNEAYQALVAQMPKGTYLLRKVLHNRLSHDCVVPVKLLDSYLLASVDASHHLAELSGTKVFDELKLRILDLLHRVELTLQIISRSGLRLTRFPIFLVACLQHRLWSFTTPHSTGWRRRKRVLRLRGTLRRRVSVSISRWLVGLSVGNLLPTFALRRWASESSGSHANGSWSLWHWSCWRRGRSTSHRRWKVRLRLCLRW